MAKAGSNPRVEKKLSTKVIIDGTPSAKLLAGEFAVDGKVNLYHAMGVVRGVKKGTSNYGEWTCFTGDFICINAMTGEEFRSSKIFLPEVVQLPLENAVADSKQGVEFGFTIGIKDSKTPVGYEYFAVPLEKPKESDAVAALKARLAPQLAAVTAKQLPAAEHKAEDAKDGKGGKDAGKKK